MSMMACRAFSVNQHTLWGIQLIQYKFDCYVKSKTIRALLAIDYHSITVILQLCDLNLIERKVNIFRKIQKEELGLKRFKRFFNIITMKIIDLMILSNLEL